MWKLAPNKFSSRCMLAGICLLTLNLFLVGLTSAQDSSTATLLSPAPGSKLTNSTITFRWSTGVGVQRYYLGVGTSPDSVMHEPWGDLYARDEGPHNLAIVSNIPQNGKPIYVRLWSKIASQWQYEDYYYSTSAKGVAGKPAVMVSPSPGSELSASSIPFGWTAGVGVQEYWLGVGSTLHQVSTKPYGDIFGASLGLRTSVEVPGIPLTGQPVFVRLWSKLNGQWTFQDYTYGTEQREESLATMLSPVPESTLSSPEVTFSWDLGNGVQEVWVGVGTSFHSVSTKPWGDVFARSVGLTTSITVSHIPLTGSDIFVRLWSKVGGAWKSRDFVYKTSAQGPSLIDFRTHPDTFQTNIKTFLVTGQIDPASKVSLNGEPLSLDDQGTFVQSTVLNLGENVLDLSIENPLGQVEHIQKVVTYNPQFNTSDRRVAYVDIVEGANGTIDGTVAVDLDQNLFLGLLPRKHVRGISPDGTELYMEDRSVIATAFHQNIGMLSFRDPIPWNGFLVSGDGMWLYSRNEKANRFTREVETLLPLSIVTGSSFGGAVVPGTPVITSDGIQIYCCSASDSVNVLNTVTNQVTNIHLPTDRVYQSDLAVSPEGRFLAKSSYSGANGNTVGFYDIHTFNQVGFVPVGGDFVGQVGFSSDNQYAFVGSSGNPRKGGKVSVINLATLELLDSMAIDLADNLVVSKENEIIVSSGNRLGIDVLDFDSTEKLSRIKSYFLGVNRWAGSTFTKPKNDDIRGIVLKEKP